MQNYVSDELTHFVGRSLPNDDARYQLLAQLVRGGVLLDPRYAKKRDVAIFHFDIESKDGSVSRDNFYPDPYFEVSQQGQIAANDFVHPEMVCFCDIPVADLGIHTSKYSRFGLAFEKGFLVRQGANPVHYIARGASSRLRLLSPGGEYPDFFAEEEEDGLLSEGQGRALFLDRLKIRTLEIIEAHYATLQAKILEYKSGKDNSKETKAELLRLVDFMMGTFCYIHGLTKVFDPELPPGAADNFYMEREWRVIGRVKFAATDIARILLPAEHHDRFRRDVPEFSGPITAV